MKKAYLYALGMTSIMGAAVQQAYAEPHAGDLTINPAVNYSFYDHDHNLDDSWGWQAGLEYAFTNHWAGEVQYAHTNAGGDPDGFPGATQSRIDGNVLYYFGNYSGWVPYLAAGVGASKFNYKNGNDHDEHPEFNIGGGTRYYFTDRLSARGDVRLVKDDIGSQNFTDVVVSLGLSYAFPLLGGEPAAATPAPVAVAPAPVAAPEPAPAPAPTPKPPKAVESIDLHLTFANGSDKIQPQFESHIEEVADFLKKYPGTTAEIEGHTDNTGNAAYNHDLSKRRAEAVKDELINKYGIDASRLTAVGYGPDRPIADNKTPAGRQQNRRVVATVTSK